jgi:capsular polysaccharide export protein
VARILFVTSPFGRFFRVFAKDLTDQGHRVWRIVWDGGDFTSTPSQCRVVFRKREADYESFIKSAIVKNHITAIVTYNDTGERNCAAIKLAKQMGLARYIIEHGYLRPHWITFDRDGVNGHSTLPKESAFYHNNNTGLEIAQAFPCRMRDQVLSAIKHFGAGLALYPFMPFDTAYYGDSIFTQAAGYIAEYLWRKTHDETPTVKQIVVQRQRGKKIFAVILQKPGDAQLRVHSKYRSNNPFLRQACESFAAFAPKNAVLVVKQHPLDYGVEQTPAFFKRLIKELNLEDRAYYLRKTSIDVVLDHADGFINVNSTAGLAALLRKIPVKCCGRAIYDMESITFQAGLDAFWTCATPPDEATLGAFIAYLTRYSQINGALYAPKGIELASKALCNIISYDLFSPHHSEAPEKIAARGTTSPVPLSPPVAVLNAA